MLISALVALICLAFVALAALAAWTHTLWARLRANDGLPPSSADVVSEKVLSALAREYDTLLACCGDGVLVVDANGVIERANVTARYLLGVPTLNMIGKPILRGTLSTELHALVKDARETRTIQRREICAPGSGGYLLKAMASPVIEEDTNRFRIILVVQDVTELRRLETVRRDFVANVSHELRTPLTSIRAMAETLQDGALEDPSVACHFLKTIIDETGRLTRISEDLLHLSQAESYSPEKSRFDLGMLCEEVSGRLTIQAQRAGIRLHTEVPTRLEVVANHDQIEQVLVNLLDNAIKYTPVGGQVRMTAEQTEKTAVIRVMDTGIGIMTEDMPRIFERFYRVDRARSRQSGGTGLGLSIVKHIVEAHGGEVYVESEFNRGSAFTFTLPNA